MLVGSHIPLVQRWGIESPQSIQTPLGVAASSPRQRRGLKSPQSIQTPLGVAASSPRQRRGLKSPQSIQTPLGVADMTNDAKYLFTNLYSLRMLALNDDRRHDDAEPNRARNGHRHDLAPLRRQNVDLIPAFERLKRPYCSQTTHQYADDGA